MGWVMGKWGRCMIFGVEVGCTESDRATSGLVDISGICDRSVRGKSRHYRSHPFTIVTFK